MARIVLIRYDGVGDTVALAPLIAALLDAGHQLGLVTTAATAELFSDPRIRMHVVGDVGEPHSVLDAIRSASYGLALIATEKPYGYALAKHARIPRRVGFWNGLAKPLKSVWIRYLCTSVRSRGIRRGGRHEVETLFSLGRGLSDETMPTRDIMRLRRLFTDVPHTSMQGVTVQVTGKWRAYGDIDAITELFAWFHRTYSARFVGSVHEDAFISPIEAGLRCAVERHTGAGSWVRALASTATLITPDTGAAHIAGMLGAYVVDCFPDDAKPAQQERWRPWASESLLLHMRDLQPSRREAALAGHIKK